MRAAPIAITIVELDDPVAPSAGLVLPTDARRTRTIRTSGVVTDRDCCPSAVVDDGPPPWRNRYAQ